MDSKVNDFLTKQVLIERNVVTFRSLSRQLNIHVNAAKNELAAFHKASKGSQEPTYATYMLTGEVAASRRKLSQLEQNDMDIDMDEDTDSAQELEDDVVPSVKVMLVGEHDVERVKTQYVRIYSEHIYSLSPSRLIDAGLICGPSEKVYEADTRLSAESAMLLGRIVGPHVQRGKSVPLRNSSSKAQAVATQKQALLKGKQTEKAEKVMEEPKQKVKEEKLAGLKPKASGVLDWSKAKGKHKEDKDDKLKGKGKEIAKTEEREAVLDRIKKSTSREEVNEERSRTSTSIHAGSSKIEVKRGIKRKSALRTLSDSEDEQQDEVRKPSPIVMNEKTGKSSSKSESKKDTRRQPALQLRSDSEDESFPPVSKPVAASAKVKKGVIVSDNDDDDPKTTTIPLGNGRGKTSGKAQLRETPSDAEKSLRAMMDIDDEEVVRVSRMTLDKEPETEETQNEDVNMVEDSEPERIKSKPRKKKEKKMVPVGKNGLKKRRVIKSRMSTDERGYMVTEDYSSYESVDEEEVEEDVSTKTKGKKGTSTTRKRSEASETKSRLKVEDRTTKTSGDSLDTKHRKPAGSSKTRGQGSLRNFFKGK